MEDSAVATPPKDCPPSWSVWKKLLIYPLFFVLAAQALFIGIIVDDALSPPRTIDGNPDDAPRMACLILGTIIGVLYLGYAALLGMIRLFTPAARRHP